MIGRGLPGAGMLWGGGHIVTDAVDAGPAARSESVFEAQWPT